MRSDIEMPVPEFGIGALSSRILHFIPSRSFSASTWLTLAFSTMEVGSTICIKGCPAKTWSPSRICPELAVAHNALHHHDSVHGALDGHALDVHFGRLSSMAIGPGSVAERGSGQPAARSPGTLRTPVACRWPRSAPPTACTFRVDGGTDGAVCRSRRALSQLAFPVSTV